MFCLRDSERSTFAHADKRHSAFLSCFSLFLPFYIMNDLVVAPAPTFSINGITTTTTLGPSKSLELYRSSCVLVWEHLFRCRYISPLPLVVPRLPYAIFMSIRFYCHHKKETNRGRENGRHGCLLLLLLLLVLLLVVVLNRTHRFRPAATGQQFLFE